jgi:iron complex transport system substrate-binding protein
MPRIVSLIASATEIVCALGLEDQLVGRSHECDHPPSVQRQPVCTGPKFRTDVSSAAIDRSVKGLLAQGLSVYQVDADLLRSLEPDVIITQAQCEVCAVSLRDVERAVCSWLGACPRLVSLTPNRLADVWGSIEQVADAVGVSDHGVELVRKLQQRMQAIAERAAGLPARPGVVCIEWIDPLMAAGCWMPELVEMAGGRCLLGQAGQHAPGLSWQTLESCAADVLVLLPCGFDLARTRQELPALTGHPSWGRLPAVRAGQVFLLDGNALFNRPGPRLVESLEVLADVLHPEVFRFGHEGTGWQRL